MLSLVRALEPVPDASASLTLSRGQDRACARSDYEDEAGGGVDYEFARDRN